MERLPSHHFGAFAEHLDYLAGYCAPRAVSEIL